MEAADKKAAKAAYMVAWRAANPDKIARNYAKRREQFAERDAAYRAAHKAEYAAWRDAHKESISVYNAAYKKARPDVLAAAQAKERALYPEKALARQKVATEVRSGRFPRANTMVCGICGEALAAHWHHHNGYEPEYQLDVIAVCIECHTTAHTEASHD